MTTTNHEADPPRRFWRAWTADQDVFLVEQYARGWSLRRIAVEMDRPHLSVRLRAWRLKLRRRRKEAGGPADLVTLSARANELCWDLETLAALLARSDLGSAPAWREELIAMAAKLNAVYLELARLRDKEIER